MKLSVLVLCGLLGVCQAFRVLTTGSKFADGTYPKPYEKGNVGVYGDSRNFQRERVNEGAFETAEQELLYEGVSPRQACPNMVGPFSDGSFYCTAREYGYCDRRSGTCFCNAGYKGIDCSECHDSHFKIGDLCFPKKLCLNDCNGAGDCDYSSGTCHCLPHRTGVDCDTLLCSRFSVLCTSCNINTCLNCAGGYYLSNTTEVCRSCYDFDPRCAGCTKEDGCTTCADSLLTSVHRSGYRLSDPELPREEKTREHSITLPFGTKSPESFADAENYEVVVSPVLSPADYLNNKSLSCSQGLRGDDSWTCEHWEESHMVCGHFGVFTFLYPNYVVKETDRQIRMTVQRSGGGYGRAEINYFVKHFTTNDSDVVATAPYTTVQRLLFEQGVVQRSFLITILDDNIVEEDEVFQVVLETPEGGGAVGAQFRANVTILDDDRPLLSAVLSKSLQNTTVVTASIPFSVYVQAVAANGQTMRMGGDQFYAIIGNNPEQWRGIRNPLSSAETLRQPCLVTDRGDGTYKITSESGIIPKGVFDLHIYHAFPRAIQGDYFYDGFFDRLAVRRLDQQVNFTWGAGRLIPRGSDYISVRWSGAIFTNSTGDYRFRVLADDYSRLWINNVAMLNNWQGLPYDNTSSPIRLTGGILHEVVLEYLEMTGNASAQLMWSFNGGAFSVIPQNNLFALFEVDRSPVKVTVLGGEPSAANTTVSGLGLINGTALQGSSFTVCPRDKFNNVLDDGDDFYASSQFFSAELHLVDQQGYDGVGSEYLAPTLVYNHTSHCFEGTYTPQMAGKYRLDVFFQKFRDEAKEPVMGSPFFIEVKPDQTSGPMSRVKGMPIPLAMTSGDCFNFSLEARDNAQNLRKTGGDSIEVYMYQVGWYHQQDGDPRITAAPSLLPSASPSGKPFQSPTRVPTLSPAGLPTFAPSIAPSLAPTTLCPSRSPTSRSPSRAPTRSPTAQPSRTPTIVPTSPPISRYPTLAPAPTMAPTSGVVDYVETSDSGLEVVRYGLVYDQRDGNYVAQICPVLSGIYEIHVLLNGEGVSNQPLQALHPDASLADPQGLGSHIGDYIDGSPYLLSVQHSEPSAVTSTAEGPGLVSAVVGVPVSFMVTVRDPYDNVIRSPGLPDTVTAQLDRSPDAYVSVWNYHNGSYNVEYIPQLDGPNLVSVFVNGVQIPASPFVVPVTDGVTSAFYSYATGPGLVAGTTGQASYLEVFAFDLSDNRKTTSDDVFTFTVSGANVLDHTAMLPCPLPPLPDHPICSATDSLQGHYFGVYIPANIGVDVVQVYQETDTTRIKTFLAGRSLAAVGAVELSGAVFRPTIFPSAPKATSSDISGTLYNNEAGVTAHVSVQLRDYFGNMLQTGGHSLELALMGVATRWGTVEPFFPEQGRPDQFYYDGFYRGNPVYYGSVVDNGDGSYLLGYNAPIAGQYVLRLSLAEAGLNGTYFNDTQFGRLLDGNSNDPDFAATRLGIPANLGSTISWTGDIGGPADIRGGLGRGTYENKFLSRVDHNISFDLRHQRISHFMGVDEGNMYHFRNHYWSARWTGLIVPEHAEVYRFSVAIDGDSTVRMLLGGVGSEFNGSAPGDVVLDVSETSRAVSGTFNFTDTKYREIVVEYAHFASDPLLTLFWESPSTPRAVVPASAFLHWTNMSHFNTTIHPSALCSACSTAVGDALSTAQVAVPRSFVVYGRDRFGNLLQRGGDEVSMVAVGRDGVAFRGDVLDYGNSTYLVRYYPTQAGTFRMYVTIGCCAPSADLSYPAEIQKLALLLIEGAPFILTVQSAPVDQSRSVASGKGLLGGVAGEKLSLTTLYRDVHNNPTAVNDTRQCVLSVTFQDSSSLNSVLPTELQLDYALMGVSATYSLTRAGSYLMTVLLSVDSGVSFVPVIGSPFVAQISPIQAVPEHARCKGTGLRQAQVSSRASFEVQLVDKYHNDLVVGGDKLYVRLLGDAAFQRGAIPVAAPCTDLRNGRYLCSYVAGVASGSHQLVVRLLNNSIDHPGGSGLTGHYFSSVDGADTDAPPVLARIDPQVKFVWPNGLVVPAFDSLTGTRGAAIPLSREAGQSVRWMGYLYSPRTDDFQLSVQSTGANVTVYVDSVLVFDSYSRIAEKSSLSAEAVYAVVVTASVAQQRTAPREVSVDLRWSSDTVREHTIPQFFLFDSAQDIALSPFPVSVSS